MSRQVPRLFFVVTINNWNQEQYQEFVTWCDIHCNYYVIGKEVGNSGTPHLQCFIALKDRKREDTLRKVFAFKPHFEVAKADGKTCSDYCKKGEQSHEEWSEAGVEGPNFGKNADFLEKGRIPTTIKGVGKVKADYGLAIELAKQRKFDAIDPGILIRHYGNLQRIAADNPVKADDLPTVCGLWIYGPPGTGKSHTARQLYPNFYDKACNKWADGYEGQDAWLLDDFDKVHKPLGHFLKRWSDKYAFSCEVKGTTRFIRPKKIIVTSNYHPNQIWDDDQTLCDAIIRRFEFRWMSEVYNPPDELPYVNFIRPMEVDIRSNSPPIPTPPDRNEITPIDIDDDNMIFGTQYFD